MPDKQAAFVNLQTLANKSRRCARPLPDQIDANPHWNGIGFSLLGFQFVSPMGQVAEILEVPHYTPLPNVQHWVKGVANVRGRLLPIFDMGEFLGGRLTNHKKMQRIMVLETDLLYLGLWVDFVYGMQHFPINSQLSALTTALPESVSSYVSGGFQTGERPWFVFNPIALAEEPTFLNVALT